MWEETMLVQWGKGSLFYNLSQQNIIFIQKSKQMKMIPILKHTQVSTASILPVKYQKQNILTLRKVQINIFLTLG